MKKNNIKILIVLLLILSITTHNPPKVYGYTFGGVGGDDSSGNVSKIEPNSDSYTADDGYEVTCTWLTSVTPWSYVTINTYDTKGNDFENPLDIEKSIKKQELDNLIAGRYLGVNIYEEKGYNVKVEYEVTAKKRRWNCTYCTDICYPSEASPVSYNLQPNNSINITQIAIKIPENYDGNIQYEKDNDNSNNNGCEAWSCRHYDNKTVYDEKDCTGTPSELDELTRPVTSDETAWCRGKAQPHLPALEPSYEVKYMDSNDINSSSSTIVNGEKCEVAPVNLTNGGTASRKCTFQYNMGNACINVTTGKVRYIGTNRNCGSNKEYLVELEKDIWPYFIPLNTQTNGKVFSIEMNSSLSKTDKGICEDIIENNEDFSNIILDSEQKEFIKGTSKRNAKDRVQKGCYYRTLIKIPIEQKFYNEINGGTEFKGFNFYYKPIDINNPFPNGLPSNSIWSQKDIDKVTGTNFNPDDITYIADVTNAKAIRDYKNKTTNHKQNLYTSWENMHVNGVSDFIENSGFVKRNIDKTDFYKLGCGPANAKATNSDGTKNYLYQQECGT